MNRAKITQSMLKVTTRYLAANFIPPFVVAFTFFVAFLITFYMFRIISLIVNKGVELMTVLNMVINLSVSFFPLATPLAVFFATIYSLGKLSEDSEIIAMRSFGMKKSKIYLPFFVVSLLISLTVFSLNSIYIPKANANFKNTIVKLTSTGMLTSIKSGQFFTDIPNVTLFAEAVSEDGNNFKEVFLHAKDKTGPGQRIIFAREGSLIKLYSDNFHVPSLRLHLTDGNIVKVDERGQEIEKIIFGSYDFPVFNTDFASTLLDKDSMKTNLELRKAIETKKHDYKFLMATKPQNNDEEVQRVEAKKSIVKSQIEYYSRIVIFPQIVLFVLLGFSLGIKKGRGHTNHNTLYAIICLLGYYAIYFFLISLAQRGKIAPEIASFTPSLMLMIVSIYFYRKLDWVG